MNGVKWPTDHEWKVTRRRKTAVIIISDHFTALISISLWANIEICWQNTLLKKKRKKKFKKRPTDHNFSRANTRNCKLWKKIYAIKQNKNPTADSIFSKVGNRKQTYFFSQPYPYVGDYFEPQTWMKLFFWNIIFSLKYIKEILKSLRIHLWLITTYF